MARTSISLSIFLISLLNLTLSQDLKFPDDFKFGVATSSYQIEGAWNEDGKSENVWDRITHSTELIKDKSTGDVACDSYHQVDRDVEIIANMNVDCYRFSLAWTRILPSGYNTEVNEAGVAYYNKLINKLLERKIEPIITLYHWDQPQKLKVLGGLANEAWNDYFATYARTAFRLFGDRVKTWITFNEPNVICHYMNKVIGSVDKSYPLGVIEYLCTKNLLKAHAEAYHIYNREFKKDQKGKVGITLNFEWAEPASDKEEDQKAAERRRQFDFGIFANPIINFDYPQVVIDRVAERSQLEKYPGTRLPPFTLAEKLKIKGTYDFLGLNHYTTWLVADGEESPLSESGLYIDSKVKRHQDPSWPTTGAETNRVFPEGLRKALKWIKDTYQNPEILITECGYSDRSEELNDVARIDFYSKYLNAVLEAIHEDEVNVKAFMAWSLMDNFEWNEGYEVKFGLYHVDFKDDKRPATAKASVDYYTKVATTKKIKFDEEL